jgi:PRC-barrel domain
MMKKLLCGTALCALMLSGALAQSIDTLKSKAIAAAQSQSAGRADVILSQKPDQWLASSFKGTAVVGADNQTIGDVRDILFDRDGKIEAYVVSVGGFLGVGSKYVAIAPQSFDVVPGQNGSPDKLKLSMTKDELKIADNFKPYEPPHTTTDMGLGGLPGSPRPYGIPPSTDTPPTTR